MKTLDDHVILYDNECPMCDLYTRAFVKTEMLDVNGRMPFTQADQILDSYHLDRQRACDEIALVDLKTGKVSYGVFSLMKILGNRFRMFEPLFNSPVFQWCINKIYKFISFNRKVIVPGHTLDEAKSCRPSFHLGYRLAYIVITWVTASLVLTRYSALLVPYVPPTNFYREFLICAGQIVFQSIVIGIIDRRKSFEYLGNMMTISLAGALVLQALSMLRAITGSPEIFLAVFFLVVGVMSLEHIRRMRLLGLPWIMTLSWIVYRILVLAIIF